MDPMHQRLLETVPVVMLNRHLGPRGELVRRIEVAEFEVAVHQCVGDEEVWIVIAESEGQKQRIEISLESAGRLLLSLDFLLEPLPRATPNAS